MHFGRTTCEVNLLNVLNSGKFQDETEGVLIHHFGPIWTRINMTMMASLITPITQIYLQRGQLVAPNRGKFRVQHSTRTELSSQFFLPNLFLWSRQHQLIIPGPILDSGADNAKIVTL